ncbi:MAG: glycine cleavage system protein GcvH [candidate division Zixibacteria bacterium]|nr:glycine cleavage system protein GcvH [candidate division Zixibacteria bacterium]
MNIPAELKYTKDHEWVKLDGNTATVGITDWAQGELGDIVFVELPQVGDKIERTKPFGTIEAVKAVSDLFAPLSGEVVEINAALEDDPMVINRDAYGDGWMVKLECSEISELDQLLDSAGYEGIING